VQVYTGRVAEVVRSTVLVIHEDGAALDRLTRLFEGRGFDVVTAATQFQANARLVGDRPIDVVVAQWDEDHRLGGEVYRWVLPNKPELRGQFVFVAAGVPDEFDALVGGRCLVIHPLDEPELVRVTEAASRRLRRVSVAMAAEPELAAETTLHPRLLLVDDDPVLLAVMARWFGEHEFTVTPATGGNAAIALLEATEFDIILTGWQMEGGTGNELIRWIEAHRPGHFERVAILADSRIEQIRSVLPEVPVFAKGQDAGVLVTVLRQIATRG
jgi:CheY-like chemotaxis protein